MQVAFCTLTHRPNGPPPCAAAEGRGVRGWAAERDGGRRRGAVQRGPRGLPHRRRSGPRPGPPCFGTTDSTRAFLKTTLPPGEGAGGVSKAFLDDHFSPMGVGQGSPVSGGQ